MKISSYFTAIFLFVFLFAKSQTTDKKPNIIVIFVDDMGYGDVGAQGVLKDIKTPHIDQLANSGIRFTNGYVTAPQCSPSRAGLITGRYQQRFGFGHIPDGPLPLSERTLADRLSTVGYITGQVGKWHLEPNEVSFEWAKINMPNAILKEGRLGPIPRNLSKSYMPENRGFHQYFTGYINDYDTNYDLQGNLFDASKNIKVPGYRLEIQTNAALEFVKRNHEKPFFLYLNYYAPHVPLEASQKYLDRFPKKMPERRRHALAMISTIDDGVGQLREMLNNYKIDNNTMIIFTSDNGAPLGITKADIPVESNRGVWDG